MGRLHASLDSRCWLAFFQEARLAPQVRIRLAGRIMETLDAKEIQAQVEKIARHAREASYGLAALDTGTKNAVLRTLAERIEANEAALIETNKQDLDVGRRLELTDALLDRLELTPKRIREMAEGVRQVADLPDPVGEEIERTERPNGLEIRKMRVPIGVVGIIYESRPNVTIDCAALCFKSGNAAILRGGKEAFHSNTALAALVREALEAHGVNPDAVQFIPTSDRYALTSLLKLDQYFHCIIPRGGESLIRFVVENSQIPVIKHYKGVCNVYVDSAADLDLAEKIVVNAKTQRPSVCNAAENLIVHEAIANAFLPRAAKALIEEGVELRADEKARAVLEGLNLPCREATARDFHEEFLDLILAIKIVGTREEAIQFVNTYGSGHSDAIVTKDEGTAKLFFAGVDTSTAYWNASTRFTDGFEFGLGAEIGISTDRLHARGPMGLRELCTYKYCVYGSGQIK